MNKTNTKYVFRWIIFLLLISCIESSANQQPLNILTSNHSIHPTHWQISEDRTPKSDFRNPADSLWLPLNSISKNSTYDEGNWFIKTEILIVDSLNKDITWGLFLAYFTTAYEIYWDGETIAHNGIIGSNKSEESAGKYRTHSILPPSLLTVGKHTLTLRVSNYHNTSSWKWYFGECILGPYDAGVKSIFQDKYQSFFIIGIICIPFLLNLLLFFARENKAEHLLFSLICFIVIVDSTVNVTPVLYDVTTTYVQWEIFTYQIITLLFNTLFPAFFIFLFSFPKKFIGIVAGINLIVFYFGTSMLNIFTIMPFTVLVISSIITLAALLKRREGSIIIILGLIVAWGAYYFNIAFAGLATVMVICTSISIANQFARKEKAEREAQLRSAHFENELLKKNINPHFLLNTLTSIIAWLRKDPKSAIILIEALAEEFRMILQISALKLIPIKQEIDLCTAHLKIMSYRKGANYTFEAVDIVDEENVPPMIFHTLIENGLTHGYENKTQGLFRLQRKRNSNGVLYILSNDGNFTSDVHKDSTRFGMRYIKNRLEESYPNRWEIISRRLVQGWETVIEIKDK